MGPVVRVQSQTLMQPTMVHPMVGAPVATTTVVGNPVTTTQNTPVANAVVGTAKTQETTGAVVGTPVHTNPNHVMEAN